MSLIGNYVCMHTTCLKLLGGQRLDSEKNSVIPCFVLRGQAAHDTESMVLRKFTYTVIGILIISVQLSAQTNTIRGNVFGDNNSNAILELTDLVQPGVRVHLYQDYNKNGVIDGDDQLIVTDFSNGSGGFSMTVPFSVLLESRISASNDDAEERISDGDMSRTSTDLELISDGGDDQLVGMRFQNMTIPQGATIDSAYIVFTVDETNTGATSVTIRGQDIDNATTFNNSDNNISSRTTTTAFRDWNSIPVWNTVNDTFHTPDLGPIVAEIVGRGGWTSGNAMAMIVNGSGERTAESFDGEPESAPLLKVFYDDDTIAYVLVIDTNDLPPGYVITTADSIAISFTSAGNDNAGNNFGFTGESVGCYAVADAGNFLYVINRISGALDEIATVTATSVEAIAFDSTRSILYGANGGQFGTISRTTGGFVNSSSTFGTGSGAAGNITFSDVDGLSIDPITNRMYGVHRTGSGSPDVLFEINTATGAHVADAFGSGVDYVQIDGTGISNEVDDIAISPSTGVMYASNDDGASYNLITINKTTGAGTLVGNFSVEDMEGLSFAEDGTLYGTTGNSGPSISDDRFYEIDQSSGVATEQAAFTSGGDFEACECLRGASFATALPIELISFEAELVFDQVFLDWSTATEINNDYFTLERSVDGKNFETIGIEAGAGFSKRRLDYRFVDQEPLSGRSFYRLKQTDFDGTFTYSAIRVVNNEEEKTIAFSAYPNPVSDQLFIYAEQGDGPYEARLLSGNGVVLLTQTWTSGTQTMNVRDLTPGLYILQLQGRFTSTSLKIIRQ